MSSAERKDSLESADDVLRHLMGKGVRLWSDNGALRYKAPKGALTGAEAQTLKEFRGQIVSLLERMGGRGNAEVGSARVARLDRIPLTSSQSMHWNLYKLHERPAVRQVAAAMLIRGPLNRAAFRESLAESIRRHDALRTQVIVVDGVPLQQVSTQVGCKFELVDLSDRDEQTRQAEVQSLIRKSVTEAIDVAVDPLLCVRLVRLRNDEHVLIVAMEHMISDAYSLGILLRDLFAGYTQVLQHRGFSLPEIPVQFSDHAAWQASARKAFLEAQGGGQTNRLLRHGRLRFPEENDFTFKDRKGWGSIRLRIEKHLRDRLTDWCRMNGTTLAMSVFACYVALVLRWCNALQVVVQYQSDGRKNPKVMNTIGYFAEVLYVHVEMSAEDTFADLVARVTQSYCKEYESDGSSFVAAQVPRPEFTKNTGFNWIPRSPATAVPGMVDPQSALECVPITVTNPLLADLEIDNEPAIGFWEEDGELVGAVGYSLNRFSDGYIQRFCRNLLSFMGEFVSRPGGKVRDVVLQ